MNFFLKCIAIIFLVAAPVLTFSQDAKFLLKEGNKLYRLEHYRNALPFFEKIIESDPNNAPVLFKTGVCYLHRYSKEKGLDYILKAYSLDSTVSRDVHYWLGRAYHQNYQYDRAIQEYTIYKNSLRKADSRRKNTDKYIAQTNTAKELTQHPEDYRVLNLGPEINTSFSEHSPLVSSDDSLLLFTSRRKKDEQVKEDYDGEFFEDILQSRKLSNGEWSASEHIYLNTTGHDASIQLFDNDNKMLLYRESKGGDIYITEKEEGSQAWKEPRRFANINTSNFEANAFITADGKTAYFSTNHYTRTGDLNIYYITKTENDSWSKPQELPGPINTSEDDDAPFVTADGKTLYFCSRGHNNMGGFDIFKSVLDTVTGEWSQPVNLGFPINTPDDDIYYYMSPSTGKIFISSYREGGYGEKDIYEVMPASPVKIICNLNPCENKKRDNLKISIISQLKNTKPVSVSGRIEDNQFAATISSLNTYKLFVYNSRDTLYTETFEVSDIKEGQTIEKSIFITCDTETEDSIPTYAATNLKYMFRDVYFEKGTLNLLPDSERELDIAAEILKKNPSAMVTIKGAISREEPKTIAAKRAKIIEEELRARGVSNVRISDTHITNGVGRPNRSAVLEVDLQGEMLTDFDPNIIPPYTVSRYYISRNIHFATAKAELSWAAKAELDVLVKLLKEYIIMNVEVSGHTDSRGPDDLNQKLSETRAREVRKYIISKGIEQERVTAIGYGESRPIADNNTPKGRLLNRRTEFRIWRK